MPAPTPSKIGAAALFEPTAPLRVARELDDLLDERPELADKLAKGETWRHEIS